MKKKIILTGITVTAFLILAIYLFNRPQLLGNMKSSCTEQTTTTSDITFSGKAGDKIKFSFRSNIENGDLNMILYDSNNHAVYTLDQAKALECFFTLDASDTYTLAAECNNFIGKYNIKVYKIKKQAP